MVEKLTCATAPLLLFSTYFKAKTDQRPIWEKINYDWHTLITKNWRLLYIFDAKLHPFTCKIFICVPHGQRVPKEPGNEERRWDWGKIAKMDPVDRNPISLFLLKFKVLLSFDLFSHFLGLSNLQILPISGRNPITELCFFPRLSSGYKWLLCICSSH